MIQTSAAMRHLRWLPLTFLCDMHGFAIFVPYAAVVLAVLPWVMRRPPQARPK